MRPSDYVQQHIIAEQDLRYERRKAENLNKKKAPKRKIVLDYTNPYEPMHFHKQLEKIKGLDAKWDYAATTKLDSENLAAVSSYSLAIGILANLTKNTMNIAAKGNLPWTRNMDKVLTDIGSVLERLLQVAECLDWSYELVLRQSVWVSIFFCTVLGNVNDQRYSNWIPFDSNVKAMCDKPDIPLAKYRTSEFVATVMKVRSEWPHIRINDEFISFLDRLRIRAAILCCVLFSVELNVHDVEAYRWTVKDGDIEVHRANTSFLNFCTFFFSDIDRMVTFHFSFCYNSNLKSDNGPTAKQFESLKKWLDEGISGEQHMPILTQFKSSFLQTILRPGDIDEFRQSSKSDVIKGSKMVTYSKPKPTQVVSELRKTDVDVVQSKWFTTLTTIPGSYRGVYLHGEAIDHLTMLVFRATLSTHTDIDFSDYYHVFCLAEENLDPNCGKEKEWQVMRVLGNFYVYHLTKNRYMYLVHTMAEAVFIWLKMYIKDMIDGPVKVLLEQLRDQMFEQGAYYTLPVETNRDIYSEFLESKEDILPMPSTKTGKRNTRKK